MVVCMKSVQVRWQSLGIKSCSRLYFYRRLYLASYTRQTVRLASSSKEMCKKIISVANHGFCKIGHFDIDCDSKMPSSGCKLPTLVQKGHLHQKKEIQKYQQCQNPDFAKPNNVDAAEPYFNISFNIYRCILYDWRRI